MCECEGEGVRGSVRDPEGGIGEGEGEGVEVMGKSVGSCTGIPRRARRSRRAPRPAGGFTADHSTAQAANPADRSWP